MRRVRRCCGQARGSCPLLATIDDRNSVARPTVTRLEIRCRASDDRAAPASLTQHCVHCVLDAYPRPIEPDRGLSCALERGQPYRDRYSCDIELAGVNETWHQRTGCLKLILK